MSGAADVSRLLATALSALRDEKTGLPRPARDICCAYVSAARAELAKAIQLREALDRAREQADADERFLGGAA